MAKAALWRVFLCSSSPSIRSWWTISLSMQHSSQLRKNCSAEETARLFFKHVKYWGIPKSIKSDWDKQLTWNFWTEFSEAPPCLNLLSTSVFRKKKLAYFTQVSSRVHFFFIAIQIQSHTDQQTPVLLVTVILSVHKWKVWILLYVGIYTKKHIRHTKRVSPSTEIPSAHAMCVQYTEFPFTL